MIFRIAVRFLFCFFFLSLTLNTVAQEVTDIRIEARGDGVIDEQSVMAYISLHVGDEFSRNAISRDVRALQRSGKFSRVDVEVDQASGGIQVTYIVDAKPRIRRIEITGAEHLGNRKIRKLMELGVGDLVDDASMAVSAQKIKEHYNKKYYPDAQVTWTISPSKEPGMANVKVVIKEGKRASVRRIDFKGNKKFRSYDLRKVVTQRRVNWLSWITGTGVFKPAAVDTDVELLRKAYLDHGYLDVKIESPDVSLIKKGKLGITYTVDEGPVYHIGKITLDGVTLFKKARVERMIRIKPGDIASVAAIEQSAQAVRDFYGGRGYIRTIVKYDLDMDVDQHIADVHFTVKEGKLVYIRDIDIRGTTVTKDKVIRRELAVDPGDPFSEVRVRISERRLRNLGYFQHVNSIPERTDDPEKYDLVFELEEKRTGQFMVGAGFSSVDDLVMFVELSQGNFDLFDWPYFTGGGQKLKLRAQFGTERRDYTVSFVEPWFLNKRLSLSVDFFEHNSAYFSDDYDQNNIGGSVGLGRPLGKWNRVNLSYSLEDISVENVSSNASEQIKQEEGKRTKSALTLELAHDTRDNVFIPHRGNRSTLSAQVAGSALKGDTEIYKLQARTSQYFPLWFDNVFRSEERRVGKECRSRWSPYH